LNSGKPVAIEEGRELLVLSVEKFLSALNANQQIRPHLSQYPFKPKNVEVEIFINNPDGSEFGNTSLSVVSSVNGIIKYKTYNRETYKFTEVYREIYEEAVEKIAQKHISEKQAVEVDPIPQK